MRYILIKLIFLLCDYFREIWVDFKDIITKDY